MLHVHEMFFTTQHFRDVKRLASYNYCHLPARVNPIVMCFADSSLLFCACMVAAFPLDTPLTPQQSIWHKGHLHHTSLFCWSAIINSLKLGLVTAWNQKYWHKLTILASTIRVMQWRTIPETHHNNHGYSLLRHCQIFSHLQFLTGNG